MTDETKKDDADAASKRSFTQHMKRKVLPLALLVGSAGTLAHVAMNPKPRPNPEDIVKKQEDPVMNLERFTREAQEGNTIRILRKKLDTFFNDYVVNETNNPHYKKITEALDKAADKAATTEDYVALDDLWKNLLKDGHTKEFKPLDRPLEGEELVGGARQWPVEKRSKLGIEISGRTEALVQHGFREELRKNPDAFFKEINDWLGEYDKVLPIAIKDQREINGEMRPFGDISPQDLQKLKEDGDKRLVEDLKLGLKGRLDKAKEHYSDGDFERLREDITTVVSYTSMLTRFGHDGRDLREEKPDPAVDKKIETKLLTLQNIAITKGLVVPGEGAAPSRP